MGELVVSRLLGCNRRPTVPGVQDPNSNPQAFRRGGGQGRSLVGWQNRYSYDTVGTTAGFGSVIMGLKASIIRFWNLTVVLTM
jgi:hypothetical protein